MSDKKAMHTVNNIVDFIIGNIKVHLSNSFTDDSDVATFVFSIGTNISINAIEKRMNPRVYEEAMRYAMYEVVAKMFDIFEDVLAIDVNEQTLVRAVDESIDKRFKKNLYKFAGDTQEK